MAFTRDSIPDLTGRTAVVTGANGGLGLETTKALAAKGAHVVMAARNLAKATEAAEQIRAETPNASLEVVPLDLGLLGSVREAAERMLAHPGLANTDLQSNHGRGGWRRCSGEVAHPAPRHRQGDRDLMAGVGARDRHRPEDHLIPDVRCGALHRAPGEPVSSGLRHLRSEV